MATVSCGTKKERFGFVQRYRELGVKRLCSWLGVTPQGFYAWINRKESQRAKEDQRLLKRITEIYWASGSRYGSPRVYKALKQEGFSVSRKRVARIMREQGLKARLMSVIRRNPPMNRPQHKGKNLLLDMAKPMTINQVWVADITYIKVKGQWQYLSTIMDQYSRRIIGWSLSTTRTTELTIKTLKYALKKRGSPKGLIFHTDRGIEYRGSEFQKELERWGIRHSVNRPRQCTDNAFMESFYHSLKMELIRGTIFNRVSMLKQALGRYINQFYNKVRLHSGIDYMSPMKYEEQLV